MEAITKEPACPNDFHICSKAESGAEWSLKPTAPLPESAIFGYNVNWIEETAGKNTVWVSKLLQM